MIGRQVVAEAEVVSVKASPAAPSRGGFYTGLSAGKAQGDQTYRGGESIQYDLDGNVFGAFIGYTDYSPPFCLGIGACRGTAKFFRIISNQIA
jgi:hypothetical protein